MIERAREALRLADSDPRRAVTLGSAVLRHALQLRVLDAAAVAARALGLASIHLHDLDLAVRHLRAAIRYARLANSPQLAAEARMTMAFAINRRGRPRQALREIDTALRDLDGVEHARALEQRGAILHQLGRLAEALASYRSALPTLRRHNDHLWTLRLLSNRALLLGQRQRLVAAEADLREADQLRRELGLEIWEAFVQQNLAEIHAMRGDVPAALTCLAAAERVCRRMAAQVGSVLADRSQILLSVRMVTEAREAAEQAVEAFERERRRIALPEVRLLLARAAILAGDPAAALRQAGQARREFSRQQRSEWATLARYLVLDARWHAGGTSRLDVARAERVAEELARAAGWPAAEIEARLIAARLAARHGRPDRARRQLELAAPARRRGPATVRARGWYAEARLRLAAGNRPGARRAVRAGLRVLDEQRASLGATDLRAHAAGHRVDLVQLGLSLAVEDGRPADVLAWAERGRASHLLLRPVRPPDDPVLERALRDLRTTVAEIDRLRGSGRPPVRLMQRQVALEREVRDYGRQRGAVGGTATGEVPIGDLTAALGDAALLEFLDVDGVLQVVTVVAGRLRLRSLTPMNVVQDLVDRVPFALRRLARGSAGQHSRSAAMTLLRRAGSQLDDAVLRPIRDEIGDRPLVIVPTGPLHSLPWFILPSCAGRPVTVAPSAALWYSAHRSCDPTGPPVVAGYGPPGAAAEATAVARIHGTEALLDAKATVASVMAALDGSGLAHLAAHGRLQADNPLFSSLSFADGPLTIYDLERLHRMPAMVILAACDSARTIDRAGDELLGISATFLSRGTHQVVASVIPVPDAATIPLMIAFHRSLVDGLAAPEALAVAQLESANAGTAAMAAAAGFVCIGASFLLPRPVRASAQSYAGAS
jgi:CHAT domain-containing protein